MGDLLKDVSRGMPDVEICQEAGVFAPVSRVRLLWALTGIILPLLALNMDEGFAISALPRAVVSLNGFDRYAWPSTSFLLISTVTMPVFAKLSDLYGRKWFYFVSVVPCVAYPLLCGAAGALPILLDGMKQVIIASGFLGVAHGGILVLSFTLIADLFPPSERGRYQGILAAVSTLPFIVGPGLGGWITDHWSWRWAFYVNVPLGVMAIVAVYFALPGAHRRQDRRSIDWTGIATLFGWLVPLLLALTWVGQSAWSAPRIRALLIASAVLLAIFLLVEKHAVEPMLPLTLFRDRRISLVSWNIFLMGIGLYGISVYLPLDLQGVVGASAAKSGAVFGLYALSVVAANVVSGRLLSRTARNQSLAIGGSGLTAIGLFLLSRMDSSTTQPEILLSAILSGVGFGVLMPTYEVLVQNATPAEAMGVATGVTQFLRSVGGAIGLALFSTMLLKFFHAHVDHLIPPGAPAKLRQAFDNPLQLAFTRPNLDSTVSQIANGESLLRSLFEGSHAGLLSAMHSIFSISAAALAVSCVLNLFLGGGIAEGTTNTGVISEYRAGGTNSKAKVRRQS
jgi:EmrB/QacA subfamily drug resistance transporter